LWKAGIHVAVEKSLEGSTAKAREILDAQRGSTARLIVAYRPLFEPATRSPALAGQGVIARLRAAHVLYDVNTKSNMFHQPSRSHSSSSFVQRGAYLAFLTLALTDADVGSAW